MLTDLAMPELGGRQLAQRLVEERPDLPVVFMSGYTDNDVARRGLLDAGVPFLEKPLSPDALTRKMRQVLEGAPRKSRAPQYADKVCEGSHSHALGPTTYISAPDRAEAETLRAGVAGEVSVHLELRPSLLRGGPPQGVDAWLIVKGANPVGAAAVKAEGVDRRVAPADQVAAAVSRAAVVEVVGPADLAVARAAGAVVAVVAVPAVPVVVKGAAVVPKVPVAPAAVSRAAADPPVAVVGRKVVAAAVVAGEVAVADRAAAAVRKAVRAAAGAVGGAVKVAVKAAVAETVSLSTKLSN